MNNYALAAYTAATDGTQGTSLVSEAAKAAIRDLADLTALSRAEAIGAMIASISVETRESRQIRGAEAAALSKAVALYSAATDVDDQAVRLVAAAKLYAGLVPRVHRQEARLFAAVPDSVHTSTPTPTTEPAQGKRR